VLLVSTAAALALSACASSSPEASTGAGPTAGPTAAADGEPLTVYSGRSEELVQPAIEQFEEQTGVDVEVRYADTAQLAAQILEEGERSPADVFFAQDAGALGAVSGAGLAATLPEDVLALVPEAYRSQDGTWVGVSGRARVVVYDPRVVGEDDVPTAVAELVEPQWQGQVGVAPANASFQSFVTALRVTEGEEAARAWLEGLVANGAQVFEDNRAILEGVDDGVLSAGLINHYYWYRKVAEVGADQVPSRLAFLPGGDPGALVNVAGVAVLEGTDQAEQAQQLVDYLLSEEGQAYFAEETLEYPLVAGVPAAADLPPLESLQTPDLDLSDLASLAETTALLEEVGLL
jgi:iron(III) transport system substrate-binding protein